MACMTIHRIGKNPNTAPSLPASAAWPIGMLYTATAITSATASDASAAIQARRRNTPSSTNSTASGSAATSELQPSEWATGSNNCLYMVGTSLVARIFLCEGLLRGSGRCGLGLSRRDDEHVEGARAVHALDAFEFDVAGSAGTGDEGQRLYRI